MRFIFNKHKVSNKKGAHEIPIVSVPLIKILEKHLKKRPNQKYLLMRNDKALNDTQIREVIRTEMGSNKSAFGIKNLRILFVKYLIKEKIQIQDNSKNTLEKWAQVLECSCQIMLK